MLPQCTKDCIATFADCVSSPDSWPFAPKSHSYFRSRACSWCIPVCRVTHIEDGSRVDKLSLFKVWADQEGTTKYDLSCRPSVIICTFPASAAQKMGVKPFWSLASIAAPCFSSASVAPISARLHQEVGGLQAEIPQTQPDKIFNHTAKAHAETEQGCFLVHRTYLFLKLSHMASPH